MSTDRAFPSSVDNPPDGLPIDVAGEEVPPGMTWFDPGMSLRDYFAAKAMQGFAADPNTTGDPNVIAMVAYEWADAMLIARKGGAS